MTHGRVVHRRAAPQPSISMPPTSASVFEGTPACRPASGDVDDSASSVAAATANSRLIDLLMRAPTRLTTTPSFTTTSTCDSATMS